MQRWRQPLLFLAAGVSLLCLCALPTLSFDYNLLHLQAEGLPSVDVQKRIFEKAGRSVLLAVSLADNPRQALELKQKFEKECRKLVQKSEIQKAKENLAREDARLVAEGDTIWAGPEAGRANINEIHKRACRRLGQERPWCYVPQSLWACPGCGTMI